jgi:hypothetical protein
MVQDFLKGAGFDWRCVSGPAPSPMYWRRPPLVTDAELSGQPLMPHLAIPVKLRADGFVDIYERFIAGYVRRKTYHDTPSPAWLKKELGLAGQQARLMFTEPEFDQVRLGHHLNLVQFAALVHYNTESLVQRGSNTFKVTTLPDYYVFGVLDGQLVTNQTRPAKPIAVRFLHDEDGDLQNAARGEAEADEHPSILERVMQWAVSRREWMGAADYQGLIVALRLLWWRSKRHAYESLRELTLRSHSDEAREKAFELARGHRNFEQPLESIQQILVPQFMGLKQFRLLFSNPQQQRKRRPTEATHRRWDTVLDKLELGIADG